MDDARFVRGLERRGDLTPDLETFIHWQRAALEPLGQRGPLDVLERQEALAVGLLDAVDAGDVG